MPHSVDVLFLVPPMEPVFRPLDIAYSYLKHSTLTNNVTSIQLGLLSMAACLQSEGFSCKYHDLGHFKGKASLVATIRDLIKKYNPKIIGLTSYTSNFNATLKVVKIIKEINASILICVGGPHVTFLDKYSLDESDFQIDIIVRGEGERTILDIAKNFLNNGSLKAIEENVLGITTKNKRKPDQKLLTNEELSNLPPIAFDLIPKKERSNFIYIPLTATRGCAYKCTFCTNPQFWRHKVRFRSVERVMEEILLAEELFPKRLIEFSDTILPINLKYFKQLVELYTESAQTPIKMALTRANLTDNQRLRIMKKLIREDGYVSIGLENGNPHILKMMGKPSYDEQLTALKQLKKFEINSIPTWMVGYCGETIETMNENLRKLEYLNKEELIRSIILNIWIPIPGSLPFQNPKEYGVKIHTYNWNFYDRAVFPPPYSLIDLDTGEVTLSNIQIWAYYIAMLALQNKWSRKRHLFNTKELSIHRTMENLLSNPRLLFFSPAGESNITMYQDLFDGNALVFNGL